MAPRPTKKTPGSPPPHPPPRPALPVQARHPPPPGLPATAPRPTAVVGRVAELMGGKGPTLAIVDTQAVKCIAVRGPRGYDAAEGVVGRKRVALVDAEGHWLAVAVVPASV